MLLKPIQPFLKKIIRSGVGRWRYLTATIGLGVALFIILLSVQLYFNFNQLLYGEDNKNDTAEFLVISKAVTVENQGKKEESYFSGKDVNALQEQPFTQKVGQISSTNFMVSISSFSNALPFYTDAYFESVPDEFIDLKNDNWGWKPGELNIPVIIPTFFLELYNTGMAMSQAELPRLSLDALQAIPLKVTIKSQTGQAEFVAHVVGTTDRLNSILVPQNFMEYANEKYGYMQQKPPTRLVLKTLDPSNPLLISYLDQQGWVTNSDKTKFSKARTIINWIVGVVGGIGIIMLLFGMLVFSLFIQVTIAASRPDIELLQTIGTSPAQLQGYLLKLFIPAYMAVIVVVVALLSVLQAILAQYLLQQQMHISSYLSVYTLGVALLWLGIVWWVNKRAISSYLSV